MAKKEQGWEFQERVDAEMAADISKERNMLDHVMFNNNGKAFITLAGIMAIANEEEFDSEIVSIESPKETQVSVVVKVTTKENRSMFSGRTEYTANDQYALTKAINIATKNACKQLLYGHPRVEEKLNEFEANNTWTPPEPKTQPKTEQPKQAEPAPQTETEQPKQAETLTPREIALSHYNSRTEKLKEINKHEKEVIGVFEDWILYSFITTADKLNENQYNRITEELKKEDCGIIGSFFEKPPEDLAERLKNHADIIAEKNGGSK